MNQFLRSAVVSSGNSTEILFNIHEAAAIATVSAAVGSISTAICIGCFCYVIPLLCRMWCRRLERQHTSYKKVKSLNFRPASATDDEEKDLL
jgi:hypothetical protein